MRANVIVLCRNNLNMTRKCLRSLRELRVPDELRILAIDNASTDGTAAWLRSEQTRDKRIWIMSTNGVRSVATLWNLGLRCCGDWEDALIVNNDTVLLPETYTTLQAWAKPVWKDSGEHGIVTCVSRMPWETLEYHEIQSSPHPDFSCFLLRRWAYEIVGEFDEGFEGAYFEDNDYHVRMHRKGVSAVSISVPFTHHGGGTMKTGSIFERMRISKCFEANQKRFFEKYGCYPGTKGYDRLFQQ